MDASVVLPRHMKCVLDAASGRLVASEDLSAGSLVFAAEPLAFAAATPSAASRACAFCFIAKPELLHCGTCKTPYCSKECQRWHWPTHKPECKATPVLQSHLEGDVPIALSLSRFQRAMSQLPPPSVDAPARSFITAAAQLGIARGVLSRAEAAVAAGASENASDAAIVDALRVIKFVDTNAPRSSSLACAATAATCTVPVTDAMLRPVGVAAVPAATALFSHSCAPNCAATFLSADELDEAVDAAPLAGPPTAPSPHIWVLRTITDVPAGAPLTHAFVDPTLPRDRRWGVLVSRHGAPPGAACECLACVAGDDFSGGGAAASPAAGDGVADELALLLRARDRASLVAFSPSDAEAIEVSAALAALGFDAQQYAVVAPPAPDNGDGGGLGAAFNAGLRDSALRREAALLTFVLCRLSPRLLPPFHPGGHGAALGDGGSSGARRPAPDGWCSGGARRGRHCQCHTAPPLSRPDVMRVVDQLYAELMLLRDAGGATLLAQHQVSLAFVCA